MNNRFDINKDDLWNKIIQDERMPKEPWTKRAIWNYLLLFSFFIFIFSLILVYNRSQSEYLTTQEDFAIKNTKRSILDQGQRVEDMDTYRRPERKIDQTSDATAINDRHTTQLSDNSTKKENLNSVRNTLSEIKEPEDQSNEVLVDKEVKWTQFLTRDSVKLNLHADDSGSKISSPSSEKTETTSVIRINEFTEKMDHESDTTLTFTNVGRLKSSMYSEYKNPGETYVSNEGKSKIEFNGNTEFKLSDQPSDDFVQLNALNKVFRNEVFSLTNTRSISKKSKAQVIPIAQESRSLYLDMNYGIGFRNLSDSLGNELPESETLEKTLTAYQIELGIQKSYGSWRIRAGLGADIQEGRGVWTQKDTIYNELDVRFTYERIEESTIRMRYQLYGNVYITAGLGYQMQMEKWTLIPHLGIKYNVFNLSNGSLLDDRTFEEINVSRSDDRSRFALTLGLNLERQIANNFSLSMGARYESPVSYQGSNGMQQSITPIYFSLGANVRF